MHKLNNVCNILNFNFISSLPLTAPFEDNSIGFSILRRNLLVRLFNPFPLILLVQSLNSDELLMSLHKFNIPEYTNSLTQGENVPTVINK